MDSRRGKGNNCSVLEHTEAIKALARSAGAALFGVALLRDTGEDFGGCSRAVSLGAVLSSGVLDTIEDSPTKIYAYHYRTINTFLDQIATRVVSYIEQAGFKSLHIPASQIVDWENLAGRVSHKEIARRAGLGFIGRNNLLVTPRFGAAVRLVSVLTDMPLAEGSPIDGDCGECRACVSVCPAGAVGETAEHFDLEKCKEKLLWFKKHVVGHHICGVCVRACKSRFIV
ncbi:MAG: epoxyqueuosine reductase [Candidatus Coatesbacteria bacterium]|nr:MAG: epoxyqueuosine reductase [Candidatus Coatesbacteria bacterium]